VFGLVLLATRSDARERRGAVLAGGLALAGLIINLLLILGGIDDLLARNALALWLPAAIAVAGGFAAARARRVGLAAAALLCAIGVYIAISVDANRNLQRPDWRVVASALGPRPSAPATPREGRAILIQHYQFLLPLALYEPNLKGMPPAGARVSEFDVVSFTSPPSNGFCWWGSACNLWPSAMQRRYRLAGFHVISRRHALQFTVLRLRASHPVRLTPHEVSRALTATRFYTDELLIQR
jgi:hypothetical protein